MGLRLIVGADEAGADYKDRILEDPGQDPRVSEVNDIGVNRSEAPADFTRPYPFVGITAGEMIRDGGTDRAILFCGTGIGVAMAANKVDGIRAPTAHDSFSVERSILSNDCQVPTMGQRVVGIELAPRAGHFSRRRTDTRCGSGCRNSTESSALKWLRPTFRHHFRKACTG